MKDKEERGREREEEREKAKSTLADDGSGRIATVQSGKRRRSANVFEANYYHHHLRFS